MEKNNHMRYENPIGYSFELPDGWRHVESVDPLSFFGPKGGIGLLTEVIQVKLNVLPAEYDAPEAREMPSFWGEETVDTFRSKLGTETNAVVLKRSQNDEISAIHDGVQYNITYSTDPATIAAVKVMCDTFEFPPSEQARKVAARMRQMSDEDRRKITEQQELERLREVQAQIPVLLAQRRAEIEAQRAPKDMAGALADSGVGCAILFGLVLLAYSVFQKACGH
jgi:hypothetical protein